MFLLTSIHQPSPSHHLTNGKLPCHYHHLIAINHDHHRSQPGLCSAARDCHESADCLYNREGGYYRWWWRNFIQKNCCFFIKHFWKDGMLPHSWLLKRCECLRGYEGDGLNCAPGPNADCLILRNCHQVILIVTCVVNDGSAWVECFNERETIFITTSWQPTNLIVGRRMCSGEPWARSLLQMRQWISRSITF